MNIEDIRKLIRENSANNVVNAKITTQSGKQFKQSLRINPLNQICIGSYKSKFPNYIITDSTTDNWVKIEVIK